MTIRQPFTFEHKPEAINCVFEISLRGRFAALLKFVEIVFDLFLIQFGGQAAKVKCHGRNVPAVVIEGSRASA